MAKTIGTSWTNIASYNWQPGTGFNITFYLDARYSSEKNNVENNESYIYTRLRSVINAGSGSGYNYNFWCSYANSVSGSGQWYFATETITESSKATISHDPDGKKTITISAGGSVTGVGLNFSMSAEVELETIPRTTKLTDKVATIGEELNITWSKASSSFRHKLVYSFGNIENEVLGENLVDNFSWTPSTDLYQYIKDSASGTGTLTLTTYSGETVIGSSSAKLTLNAKDDETTKPVIDAGWVYDSRDLTVNLTGDNTKLVIGQSTAVLNLQFTSQQYATIKSLKVNGVEQSFSVTDEETYQSGVARINYENVATNVFNIVITDSRGFVNEAYSITNEKVDYIDLDCLPTFKRIQPTTGEVGLEFDGKYFNNTFGEVHNSLKISYSYKIRDEETYSDEIVLVENTDYKVVGNTFHSGDDEEYKYEINLGSIFNYKKVYNFILYVEDEITRLAINALVIKGIPIFWWNGDKVTINGDLYIADNDGNNPVNIKNNLDVVVDNLDGNATDKAPSVRSVLEALEKLKPVVLYESSSGTTGNITLSDNYTNYSKLEITAKSNGTVWQTFKIPTTQDKFRISIVDNNGSGTNAWIKTAFYELNGTTITCTDYFWKNINGNNYGAENTITIYEVLGHK